MHINKGFEKKNTLKLIEYNTPFISHIILYVCIEFCEVTYSRDKSFSCLYFFLRRLINLIMHKYYILLFTEIKAICQVLYFQFHEIVYIDISDINILYKM